MVKDGYITQAQMSAQKFPTLLTDKSRRAASSAVDQGEQQRPVGPVPHDPGRERAHRQSSATASPQQQLETGGYKVVTTISRSMEAEMYKAVNENLNSQSISNTSRAPR